MVTGCIWPPHRSFIDLIFHGLQYLELIRGHRRIERGVNRYSACRLTMVVIQSPGGMIYGDVAYRPWPDDWPPVVDTLPVEAHEDIGQRSLEHGRGHLSKSLNLLSHGKCNLNTRQPVGFRCQTRAIPWLAVCFWRSDSRPIYHIKLLDTSLYIDVHIQACMYTNGWLNLYVITHRGWSVNLLLTTLTPIVRAVERNWGANYVLLARENTHQHV